MAVQLHEGGISYVKVALQLGSAEKEAVTIQLTPFAGPVNEKLEELPNGALKTCWPPHEFTRVSVPDPGAFV
jgi:hypothetical protein